MMETNRTNKDVLVTGLKWMGGSLACMFIGPTLIYISQTQLKEPLDIVVLILASIICILAIGFGFKGIQTVLNSMFNKK